MHHTYRVTSAQVPPSIQRIARELGVYGFSATFEVSSFYEKDPFNVVIEAFHAQDRPLDEHDDDRQVASS